MAEELVLFGVEKLWNLLSQEYELLKGVEEQVSELRSDLDLLKSFLKDAGAKKHTSALVRHCVDETKEIVYDAEDVIEEFILKERHGKESGFEKRIRRFACFIPERREIAPYITCISKRISRVVRNMQSFNVQQKIEDDSVRLQSNREWEMRQTFSKEYESDFVGLETDINILIEKLVKNDNVQVVTVTGIGGLGKTTLVRQFFNHNDVKNHFNRFAWVCVSQDFTLKNVWQKILIDLKPKEEKKNILEMAESTLQGELFLLLETSKSLIVLDDVWKEEDWHLIKPIFPPTKGWKVLLTSRNNIVAVPGDTKYYNHTVKCLTSEESWTLFERIAFPRKYVFGSSMEEKAKEILNKHCKGLPLAVKVFGGLLATKYSSDDWERVFENIGSHMMGKPIFNDDNNRSIYHVLSVSFEELPSYLKHCFLFLAHFPEDHEINVEILSYYWAAEGIFEASHYNGETIRDVADDCIEKLVRRNMVISKRDVLSSKYETCHLHDMMREMCLLKAKEENFLHIINVRSSTSNSRSPCRSRRLFCQIPTALDIDRDINNFKLRSLLIVKSSPLTGRSFKRLKFLRVLDLFCIEFQKRKLVSSIGKLIHLRYLNLKDVILSHLPSSIGNLTLLIYLNLKVSVVPIFVPNVLMGMQDLRYLVLPNYMHKMTKLQLSSLVNLESLKRFSTNNCRIEDLRGMVRLKTLSIWITDETSIETISASIGGLEHLEYLRIEDEDGRSEKKNKEGLVLNFINLKRLILSIYMPRLPKEHFPSSLTSLYLRRCRLQEDPMPIIEKLPQLKLVILEERSFCGKKMVCSAGRFPQLEELSLIGLDEWQEWIVEDGSMPLLHTLTIIFCPNLKELHDGIYSVKDLTISKKWKKRLSEGGEDYNKVKHMPSVAFIQDY